MSRQHLDKKILLSWYHCSSAIWHWQQYHKCFESSLLIHSCNKDKVTSGLATGECITLWMIKVSKSKLGTHAYIENEAQVSILFYLFSMQNLGIYILMKCIMYKKSTLWLPATTTKGTACLWAASATMFIPTGAMTPPFAIIACAPTMTLR